MSPLRFHTVACADGVRLRVAAAEPRLRRGVCVFFNGQGEFIEKYREVIFELIDRSFVVATLDWRGQGGSMRLTDDPRLGHVEDFAAYERDVETFFAEAVDQLTDGPVIGLGHSMGGHMLIRAMHAMPQRFAAAVLCAPMIQIHTRGVWRPFANAAIAVCNGLGLARRYAWKMKKRNPASEPFDVQIVTSDAARYARTQDFLTRHPEMGINGPSWGWLGAAQRAIKEIHAPGYAQAIPTPVLIAGAGADRVCVTDAARAYAMRLPQGRFIEIAGAKHEILRERDSYRAQLWQAFDAFVNAHIPAA